MKVRDVIKRVEAEGWYYIGSVGRHRHYKHAVKPGKLTISGHPSKDMAVKTLKSV